MLRAVATYPPIDEQPFQELMSRAVLDPVLVYRLADRCEVAQSTVFGWSRGWSKPHPHLRAFAAYQARLLMLTELTRLSEDVEAQTAEPDPWTTFCTAWRHIGLVAATPTIGTAGGGHA